MRTWFALTYFSCSWDIFQKNSTKEIYVFISILYVKHCCYILNSTKELRKIKYLNIRKWLRWKYWVTQLRFYSSLYIFPTPTHHFPFDRIMWLVVVNIWKCSVLLLTKRWKLFWIKIKLFKLCIRSKVIEFYGYFMTTLYYKFFLKYIFLQFFKFKSVSLFALKILTEFRVILGVSLFTLL